MAHDHIETRTPEQMYQDAYRHCIECGDHYLESYNWKHNYLMGACYRFNFDVKNVYVYVGYDPDIHFFLRQRDLGQLRMTKYAEPPQIVE